MSAPTQLDRSLIEQIVRQLVLTQANGRAAAMPAPPEKPNLVVSISARHCHLTDEHVEILFGPGAKLIPLGQLPSRMSELDSADEIVLQCKSGVRSARALKLLQEAGFGKLYNVEGGIAAWAEDVDPSVPKY